ncbi:MAG: RibD family protein [Pseudomonadota bacterium]
MTSPELLPMFDALAAAKAEQKPLVVAQLGQSLDGRIATPNGHSHYVNGQEAIGVLHHLRAAVDAVIVGAGTAVADDPQLTVRRCPGENPARVLIDRRRRAGASLRMLTAGNARRIVFGNPLPDDDPAVLVVPPPDPEGIIPPAFVIRALADLGLKRVLVEGGATTVSAFVSAGTVDRICVAVAPIIIGSGPVGLALPPITRMDDAVRPEVAVLPLGDGDVLFDCKLPPDAAPRPEPEVAGG